MPIGSREDVWAGRAHRTAGGLTRDDLFVGPDGKVKSKRMAEAARARAISRGGGIGGRKVTAGAGVEGRKIPEDEAPDKAVVPFRPQPKPGARRVTSKAGAVRIANARGLEAIRIANDRSGAPPYGRAVRFSKPSARAIRIKIEDDQRSAGLIASIVKKGMAKEAVGDNAPLAQSLITAVVESGQVPADQVTPETVAAAVVGMAASPTQAVQMVERQAAAVDDEEAFLSAEEDIPEFAGLAEIPGQALAEIPGRIAGALGDFARATLPVDAAEFFDRPGAARDPADIAAGLARLPAAPAAATAAPLTPGQIAARRGAITTRLKRATRAGDQAAIAAAMAERDAFEQAHGPPKTPAPKQPTEADTRLAERLQALGTAPDPDDDDEDLPDLSELPPLIDDPDDDFVDPDDDDFVDLSFFDDTGGSGVGGRGFIQSVGSWLKRAAPIAGRILRRPETAALVGSIASALGQPEIAIGATPVLGAVGSLLGGAAANLPFGQHAALVLQHASRTSGSGPGASFSDRLGSALQKLGPRLQPLIKGKANHGKFFGTLSKLASRGLPMPPPIQLPGLPPPIFGRGAVLPGMGAVLPGMGAVLPGMGAVLPGMGAGMTPMDQFILSGLQGGGWKRPQRSRSLVEGYGANGAGFLSDLASSLRRMAPALGRALKKKEVGDIARAAGRAFGQESLGNAAADIFPEIGGLLGGGLAGAGATGGAFLSDLIKGFRRMSPSVGRALKRNETQAIIKSLGEATGQQRIADIAQKVLPEIGSLLGGGAGAGARGGGLLQDIGRALKKSAPVIGRTLRRDEFGGLLRTLGKAFGNEEAGNAAAKISADVGKLLGSGRAGGGAAVGSRHVHAVANALLGKRTAGAGLASITVGHGDHGTAWPTQTLGVLPGSGAAGAGAVLPGGGAKKM